MPILYNIYFARSNKAKGFDLECQGKDLDRRQDDVTAQWTKDRNVRMTKDVNLFYIWFTDEPCQG